MTVGLRRSAAGLVRATHPLPALAVTLLVSAVAASRGARGGTLALVLLSTAAGQASVGWSNDYLDRERDRASGRREKPIVAGDVRARTVLLGAFAAFPVSVALSVPLSLEAAGVMLAAVASAWLYNAGLKSTVFSWLPYAVSFGLAPVYIWLVTGETLPPGWLPAGTALLGVAGHLVNVIPDLDADRSTIVRGLPHRLGLGGSLLLACATLLAVMGLVLYQTRPLVPVQVVAAGLATALIGVVAWAGLTGRVRLGWRLTIAAVGAIVAAFVASPLASRL